MECCMVTIATNKIINHSHKHAEQNLSDRGIDAILLYLILFHLHKV